MGARSGSLAWLVIVGAITLVISGGLWGVMDQLFVDNLAQTDIWAASTGSVVAMSRGYIRTTWDWLLLIVVLRLGIEALVASRLAGATTKLPLATMLLFAAHLLFVSWALVFPEISQTYYQHAQNATVVSDAGYMTGVSLAYEWGIGVLPAVMLLISDVWYLSSPIRNDLLRR